MRELGQVGVGTTYFKAGGQVLTDVAQILSSPSTSHSSARLTNGQVKCWGTNDFRQLGDGTTVGRPSPVNVWGR